MADWRCEKCNEENPAKGNFCRMCGEPRAQKAGNADLSPLDEIRLEISQSRTEARSFRSETEAAADPLAGIRKESGPLLDHTRSPLEQFRRSMPKLSDLKLEMPQLGSFGRPAAAPPEQRTATHTLQIQTVFQPTLNFALAHAGLPIIRVLEIMNTADEDALDILIKAWVATDYGEPWQKTIPRIPARKGYQENEIVIPLTKSRLQEVREAEKATLRIDLFSGGELQVSQTFPIEVLAYNEWFYHPQLAPLAACFVQPNSEAVENIVSKVRDHMQGDNSLDGYQSGDPEKVLRMLEGLFLTLQKDLKLSYINPPPSFEKGSLLPTGEVTISQKVFFPEQILKHRRGTCLDLALLCAACVERMGLAPLFFLIKGHAFFGAWIAKTGLQIPLYRDHANIRELLESNAIVPMNSTTFTDSQREFSDCVGEGIHYLSDPAQFMCAVDVSIAHRMGCKPVPPIVEPR